MPKLLKTYAVTRSIMDLQPTEAIIYKLSSLPSYLPAPRACTMMGSHSAKDNHPRMRSPPPTGATEDARTSRVPAAATVYREPANRT